MILETRTMLHTLTEYIEKDPACVQTHENTQDYRIEREVCQDDEFSTKLLTALLEYMFKRKDFGEIGININDEK